MSYEPSALRYSAIAQGRLIVGGAEHRLAQIAPDFVVLSRPATVPEGPATLVLTIDGREERHALRVGPPDAEHPEQIAIVRASALVAS